MPAAPASSAPAPTPRIAPPLPLRPGEKGRPLSAVDIAWLRMDEPSNLMHIHGVLVLEGSPPLEAVVDRLGGRLAEIPRFRQRIARDGERMVWVDDAEFDLAPPRLRGDAWPRPAASGSSRRRSPSTSAVRSTARVRSGSSCSSAAFAAATP